MAHRTLLFAAGLVARSSRAPVPALALSLADEVSSASSSNSTAHALNQVRAFASASGPLPPKQPAAAEPQEPGPAMRHKLEYIKPDYKGGQLLKDKVAIITGADSGIGRATAIHFAREGAVGLGIMYLNEHDDARETQRLCEAEGAKCVLVAGDVGSRQFCRSSVDMIVEKLGRLDVLINNAGEQTVDHDFENYPEEKIQRTFRTNVYGYMFMAQAALKHMGPGSSIVNNASLAALKGNELLVDYSASKGAIISFTRALALQLVIEGIRVNGVAPGTIATPLTRTTFSPDYYASWSKLSPMLRTAQPSEVAPSIVFLASNVTSSYFTGQFLQPTGGII